MKDLMIYTILDDQAMKNMISRHKQYIKSWGSSSNWEYDHKMEYIRDYNGTINTLRHIKEDLQDCESQYRNFLILRYNIFPIRKDWHLNMWCEPGFELATLIRYEVLDGRFCDASLLFGSMPILNNISFGLRGCKNTLGQNYTRIDIGRYNQDLRDKVQPMLRTNVYNISQIYHGIYHDSFYAYGNTYPEEKQMLDLAGDYWSIVNYRKGVVDPSEIHKLAGIPHKSYLEVK